MSKRNYWPVISIILAIVVLIAAGIYIFYWQKNSKIYNPKPPQIVSSPDEIKTAQYTNAEYGITANYPFSWKQSYLGGDKNVTEPLKRENIVFLYDPNNLKYENDPISAQVSAKILRFVVEQDKQINFQEDWLNYIKSKVDDYIATFASERGYSLISLSSTNINGLWAVEEKYLEPSDIQSRDLYIYNKSKHEFYQIITKAPKAIYDKAYPYLDLIVSSFKISQ
ncbi:MAG: hypothetical protein M1338_04635 [Patescibacteria group bacterium]|nr:hypothetical protein [Patescibacteria group bacterium]